ncbi:MAG: hypothetical protein ACXWVD_00125 [Telluria sp.]
MFTVTTRKTYLPAGTEVIEHYRHIGQGELCMNRHWHMTKAQADTFARMVREGQRESHDIVAGSITTYSITEDLPPTTQGEQP